VLSDGADLGRLAVFALGAGLQIVILSRAWRAARRDDRARLVELGETFAADLSRRAGRGREPDWLRYRGELDRLFESRDEQLRALAAAALAAGLGSTLVALLVGLLVETVRQDRAFDSLSLLHSAGVCLMGSLLGVGVNLAIVLILLPAAERRHSTLAESLLRHIGQVADQHPPVGALTGPLREELAAIRESLGAGLARAFSEAVTGWPQVVARLGEQVDALGALVETQGRGIGEAARDLASCSLAVARSSQALQPAAQNLGDVALLLVQLPAQLRDVIDASRTSWAASLKEQQEDAMRQLIEARREAEEASQARERQMLAAVRELQAGVADQRAAVDRIPGLLADEVARVSQTLGREFGSEARAHTLDLANRLAQEHERLWQRIELHEHESRNNVSVLVAELLAQVGRQVDEGIVAQLRLAGARLQELAELLPAAAVRLEQAQEGWTQAQRETLTGWQEVGRRTEDAARRLAEMDGHLGSGVAALAASADHLERVANADGEFESALRAVMVEVAARHLAESGSFREELMAMARELKTAGAQLDGVLAGQSELIRQCIGQLMKGRQAATLETRV
jgi:hypothetical protein